MDNRTFPGNALHGQNERSFTVLVERFLPLVYGAARRQVREPAVAEDVTQAVFMLLARKSHTLYGAPSLSGWLLKATYYCAKDAQRICAHRTCFARTEGGCDAKKNRLCLQIRRGRSSRRTWMRAKGVALSAMDRSAITLRYLDDQSIEEVGDSLGITRDAAYKRLSRAVQRLRLILQSRSGVPLSAAALPAILCSRPALTIPGHLLSTISTAAVQGTASGSSGSVLIAKGAAHMMIAAKLKLAVAAVVLVTAATGSSILLTARAEPAAAPAAAPVTYSEELQKRIAAARKEVAMRQSGVVVVGRVVLDGPDDPRMVNSQMEILADGTFATAAKDPFGPIGFRMNGYAPFDLDLNGKTGDPLDVGEIKLRSLAENETVAFNAPLTLEDSNDPTVAKATLSITSGPVNTLSGGTEGRPRWPAPIRATIDKSGSVHAAGLSPTTYYCSISARGYVSKGFEVDLKNGDVAAIALERARHATLHYIIADQAPFDIADEANALTLWAAHGGKRRAVFTDGMWSSRRRKESSS